MIFNKAVIALPSALLIGTVIAAPPIPKTSPWIMTLSLGSVSNDAGKTQTLYVQPDVIKTYVAIKHSNSLGSGEFFLGKERRLRSRFQGQLGLALAATTDAKLHGDIWEDADPDFNNYTYSYKIKHAHIAVKGNLLADITNSIQLYLSSSVGIGLNHAHNFNIAAKIYEEVSAPYFTAHSSASFTYNLGAGIQKALNNHWKAGVGYEFSDWGKSGLASAPLQTIGSGLQLNHLYTNQLQLRLSFTA